MELEVEFSFCSAHRLPHHPGACSRLHGHEYRLLVSVAGKPDPKSGMIIDFEELQRLVLEEAVNGVDHGDLNAILENPTAENLVVFLWGKLKPKIQGLKALRLWETPQYSVTYRGE